MRKPWNPKYCSLFTAVQERGEWLVRKVATAYAAGQPVPVIGNGDKVRRFIAEQRGEKYEDIWI